MGEGGSLTEFGPFDRTIEAKREVPRAVIPMFADSGFEYDGLVPAALRLAEAGAEAAPAALGRLFRAEGLNMRDDASSKASAPTPRINSYTKRMTPNTNQNMTLVSYFMCAETDEEA